MSRRGNIHDAVELLKNQKRELREEAAKMAAKYKDLEERHSIGCMMVAYLNQERRLLRAVETALDESYTEESPPLPEQVQDTLDALWAWRSEQNDAGIKL